jgi:hypothetical protein
LVKHTKIKVPRSSVGVDVFADFCRFGEPGAATALICYWGGAISPAEYETRRCRLPMPIVEEFEAALGEAGAARSVDLMVVSDPPIPVPTEGPRGRSERRANVRALFAELLAASPNPSPSALGYVGNSMGAYVVTCLALDVPGARVVATVAGVGMSEAFSEPQAPSLDGVAFFSFVNVDDPAASMAESFQSMLGARSVVVPIQVGPGGHAFEDYAANGAVRSAFARALRQLV